jgi:microcystin degradation protein MlrC
VLAGAPGDGTAILAAALRRKDGLRGTVPVTDPTSVEAAVAAGLGARITLAIGGHLTPGFEPLEVTGTVVALGDGQFVVSGPVFGGEHSSLGRTAVLLIEGRLSALLTSEAGLTHTPAAFSSQGIDVSRQDFVVAKSGMHFQSNFSGVATPLSLATPGLTYFRKGFFCWKNARFWPEHDIVDPEIRASVFEGRNVRKAVFASPDCP